MFAEIGSYMKFCNENVNDVSLSIVTCAYNIRHRKSRLKDFSP